MERKDLLILCISIEQMKNTIGHKDSTNEAAAEKRSKNREDKPSKQNTTASKTNEAAIAERRSKNREDGPSKQDTITSTEKRSKYIQD